MLDSYYLLNEKIKKYILFFPAIVIIIFFALLLLINKVKISTYIQGTATTVDYNTHLLLMISIPLNKLKYIENHNKITINEERYNYQIKEIKNNNQSDNITIYLSTNLTKKEIKNNNTMDYKIEIDKINFFDYLRKN